jgi:hypothetical protein
MIASEFQPRARPPKADNRRPDTQLATASFVIHNCRWQEVTVAGSFVRISPSRRVGGPSHFAGNALRTGSEALSESPTIQTERVR